MRRAEYAFGASGGDAPGTTVTHGKGCFRRHVQWLPQLVGSDGILSTAIHRDHGRGRQSGGKVHVEHNTGTMSLA